LKLFYSKQSGS